MIHDIESILVSAEQLEEITSRIADQINRDYANSQKKLVLICILKGSLLFSSDLMKKINSISKSIKKDGNNSHH